MSSRSEVLGLGLNFCEVASQKHLATETRAVLILWIRGAAQQFTPRIQRRTSNEPTFPSQRATTRPKNSWLHLNERSSHEKSSFLPLLGVPTQQRWKVQACKHCAAGCKANVRTCQELLKQLQLARCRRSSDTKSQEDSATQKYAEVEKRRCLSCRILKSSVAMHA